MLKDKVFLITGANGGLGGATAVELARQGATVVLLGRKVRQLERVYDAVIKVGPDPMIYPLDLEGAGPDEFFEMAQTLEREVGRLDGVIHMAANFEGLTPLLHLDPAKLARAMHINFTSMSWLSQALLPLLADTAKKRASPSTILLSVDDAARVSSPFWGGYGVSHMARRNWVSMASGELGSESPVRILGFMPGPLRTMLRSRAYAQDVDVQSVSPTEVAPEIAALLADDSVGTGTIVEAARVRAK